MKTIEIKMEIKFPKQNESSDSIENEKIKNEAEEERFDKVHKFLHTVEHTYLKKSLNMISKSDIHEILASYKDALNCLSEYLDLYFPLLTSLVSRIIKSQSYLIKKTLKHLLHEKKNQNSERDSFRNKINDLRSQLLTANQANLLNSQKCFSFNQSHNLTSRNTITSFPSGKKTSLNVLPTELMRNIEDKRTGEGIFSIENSERTTN